MFLVNEQTENLNRKKGKFLDGLNSRIAMTEERISEIEDRSLEIIQSEGQMEEEGGF